MTWSDVAALPVARVAAPQAHCSPWVPNALLPEGLAVAEAWGFACKTRLVLAERRKDGGPDGRGVGFYFRDLTEPILFAVRELIRALAPARRQVNLVEPRKREHSPKPEELCPLVERCSPGPFLELLARHPRSGWTS